MQEENLSYLHVRTDNGQTLGKQMVTAKQCSNSQNCQLTSNNIGIKQQTTALAGNDVKQCSNDVNTEGSSNFFQLTNLATSFDMSMTTSSTTTTTITTATSLNSKISEGIPSQNSQNTKNVMLLPIGTESKSRSNKPRSQTITNKPIPPPVPLNNVIVLKLDGSSPSGNCNERLLPQNISYQSPAGTDSSKVNVNGVINQPIWIPVQNNNVKSPEGISSIFLHPVCTVSTISSPPGNNKQVAPLPPSLGLYCNNNGQQQLSKVLLAKNTTNISRPTIANKNARLPISTSLFEGKRRPVRNPKVRSTTTTIAVHHSDSEDNDDPNDADYTPESEFAKCSSSNKNKTTGNKTNNGNKVDVAIATSTSSNTATTTQYPFPERQRKRRLFQTLLAEFGQPSGKSGDTDGGSIKAHEVKADHSAPDVCVVNAPQSSLDVCAVNMPEPKTTTRASGKKRKKQAIDEDSSQQSSDDDNEVEEKVVRKRVPHQCKFCGKHLTHLLRHFRAIHSTEPEIIKLLAMPVNSAAWKILMVQLGKDALITNKKSVRDRLQSKPLMMLETSDNNKNGHDLGEPSSVVYPKTVLRFRQQRACAAKIKQEVDDTNKETPSKKKFTANSSEPKLISKQHLISDAAVKRVNSVMQEMKQKELIAAVRGDNIALKYCYVASTGSNKYLMELIVQIGRLLLELQKVHKSTLSASSLPVPPLLLADYIYSREKFALVKKAAQNLSNYNEKTGKYTFLSVIKWINRTLKTCASLAEDDANQLHDAVRARAAQIFSTSCDENFSELSQNRCVDQGEQQAQSSKDSAKPTKPITQSKSIIY